MPIRGLLMLGDRLRQRLELRRSNASVPHRNRHRERKSGQSPWEADEFRDQSVGEDFDDRLDEYIRRLELGE